MPAIILFLALLFPFSFCYAEDNDYSFIVQPGDSLSEFFDIIKIDRLVLFKLLAAHPLNKKLNKLKPGQLITITLNDRLVFKKLYYKISKDSNLIVRKKNKRFITYFQSPKKQKKNRKNWSKKVVTIKYSFFYDGAKSGLNQATLSKVYRLFVKIIDFKKELAKGDKFILTFDNKKLLSAHYINKNRRFDIYLYKKSYYDADGYKVGKLFEQPLKKYNRISSPFNLRRIHPVLKTHKPHKGTDYAAVIGTPVYAARDGKVRFVRIMRGYGKVIYINHDKKYTTVYAHLSKFDKKIKEGKPVKRGAVIGYVGKTGLVTGPHLHFETRVYNVAQNPKIMLGKSFAKKQPKNFKRFTKFVNDINDFIAP